jgi:hypothetical protein
MPFSDQYRVFIRDIYSNYWCIITASDTFEEKIGFFQNPDAKDNVTFTC